MRVLVVSDQWFPTYRGGSARVATDSARALAARGHTVDVVAPSREPEVTRALRRGPVPQTLADPLAAAAAVRSLRRRYDVVLAHQSTVAAGASLALADTPVAYVFHASAPREAAFDGERATSAAARAGARALGAVLARLERRALTRAAAVLVLSEYSAALAAQAAPDAALPLARVGGGVDVEQFSPGGGRAAARSRLGLDPDRPLLLTVRRLEPRMGLEVLLEALRLVDAQLVVGGSGSLRGALEDEARRLGVADRVRFAGRIPDAELPDWYRAADVFVLPTIAYEGFGMVTAEALACGTPVVGTPVGATPELLAPLEPRLLAAAAVPRDLAAAVETVLELPADELGRRCRAYAVERLAWDAVAERWEAALEAAAGPRPSADDAWTFFQRQPRPGRLPSSR